MSSHTRTSEILLCGIPVEVEVSFTVHSFGTPDGWREPGDPPEVEIEAIHSTLTDRDLTALCHNTRTDFSVQASSTRRPCHHEGRRDMLDALLGVPSPTDRLHPCPGLRAPKHFATKLEVVGETIADSLMDEICSNLHEYEDDGYYDDCSDF